MDIDVEEASKKDSSNPYFYVQYAVARAHQLMNKYQLENKIEDITEFKYIGASEKERDLMIKIAK
ncbi:MAG: hypothetical protein DRP42_00170 [Tenericutes bacterium]|nr:MAG: hypothetical protein DRP42_00170 [Mycoplasmatota bacterium]